MKRIGLFILTFCVSGMNLCAASNGANTVDTIVEALAGAGINSRPVAAH